MTNADKIAVLTELAEEFEEEAAKARAISRGITNNGMTYNGHAAYAIREKIEKLRRNES